MTNCLRHCIFVTSAALLLETRTAMGAALEPGMEHGAELMPVPAEVRFASGRFPITAAFRFAIQGYDDPRLRAGLERARQRWAKRTGLKFTGVDGNSAAPALLLECSGAGNAVPKFGEDETYSLQVTTQGAVLRAPAVVGGLRGLETLLQLLQQDADGFYLPVVTVNDRPRFPWRGLLIDVCRHWQPVEVIKRNLDGMAMVKLNVLHLHLTEDQGFRIESRTHPELHEQGSDGHYFTQAQIREIVAYAAERGIRVLPEFDMPGHTTSWVVSHPELASGPGPYTLARQWGVFNPVLDPTNEKVYALLEDFLGEMAALFPDEYLHIGGDENNGVQWSANARIQAFIREHGLKDNAGLHAYFNQRVSAILRKLGRKMVGWDEIMNPNLPSDIVVQSWRGAAGLAEVAAGGHFGILSNGYYIDLNYPAADHYQTDPIPATTTLTPSQQQRVLGGEATMWTEWITPDFIDQHIWPRTAAIAERLWSPQAVGDVADMYRRLDVIGLRLHEAGLQPKPWPSQDVLGLGTDAPVTKALLKLAAIVEPVKRYARLDLQADATQFTPLNELADWALPESREARLFDAAVTQWISAPGPRDPQAAAELAAHLETWRQAGELAAQAPAGVTPAAQGRAETARSLATICRIGREAVKAVDSGRTLGDDWRLGALAALDHVGTPNAAAVEFPFLPALRLLVAAATGPAGARPGH